MARTMAGLNSNAVSDAGGSVRVTIASNVGQGNGGTSLPCRKVFITQPLGNTGIVRVNVGAAASATVGIEVPKGATTAANGTSQPGPLELNISDVSKLYFYSGTDDDVVDILYLK